MENNWNVLSVLLCYIYHDCSSDVNHDEYIVTVMTIRAKKAGSLDVESEQHAQNKYNMVRILDVLLLFALSGKLHMENMMSVNKCHTLSSD